LYIESDQRGEIYAQPEASTTWILPIKNVTPKVLPAKLSVQSYYHFDF